MPIKFKRNSQKAIECVLWIIQRGESNMYNIWKILFAAEKYHLNSYGRPITGDEYVAMEYGTVPYWLYDGVSANSLRGIVKNGNILHAERAPIDGFFSKSDIKALEHGYSEYAGLTFSEVMTKNHREPAWVKAWNSRGLQEKVTIPFDDIIEEEQIREYLEPISEAIVL